jgi:hypothetical protein
MHNAESILIIILAVTLTIFLIVAITVLILIAKLVRVVKHLVDRAEHLVETASETADIFKDATGPLALFKLIRNIVKTVEKKRQ